MDRSLKQNPLIGVSITNSTIGNNPSGDDMFERSSPGRKASGRFGSMMQASRLAAQELPKSPPKDAASGAASTAPLQNSQIRRQRVTEMLRQMSRRMVS